MTQLQSFLFVAITIPYLKPVLVHPVELRMKSIVELDTAEVVEVPLRNLPLLRLPGRVSSLLPAGNSSSKTETFSLAPGVSAGIFLNNDINYCL